ncbi:MAG: hypothetical protein IJT44_06865 [Clostridia bacterium]|nr:hypothetical protein [Clostridia bacterium]
MKRLIAILLCLALLCGSAGVCASAAETPGTDIPTVYVLGTGSGLVAPNPDGTERRVYKIPMPDDFVSTTVKENFDVFKRAFFTQQWDEFCVMLHDVITPLFDELRLDENGEAPNGSHCDIVYDRSRIDGSKVDGKYPTARYWFAYDWRMDPYKTADELHRYIEDVLAVTGEEKVNLIGRCLGACITAAYMEKYDGEHVASYLLYAGALYGATPCSKAFSGELYLESGGVERYLYDVDLEQFVDDVTSELLRSFVTLLRKTGGLNIATWAVNNVFRQIKLKVVPPIVSETYGTFPAYWAMVSDRDYEKAKETVFYGADMEKWANFIRIIDAYHYNVQVRTPELLAHYREKGIRVANVVKYGWQEIPVTHDSDKLSDGLCRVEDASLGAVTAPILGTLKKSYLKKADMQYVSPDLQIDASACLLPDRTWFIKDLAHMDFPESVERLFDYILNEPDCTVRDNEAYPQYLVYDSETEDILPMTAENCDTTGRYRHTFFDTLKRFLKALMIVIRRRIESKRGAE